MAPLSCMELQGHGQVRGQGGGGHRPSPILMRGPHSSLEPKQQCHQQSEKGGPGRPEVMGGRRKGPPLTPRQPLLSSLVPLCEGVG